MEAFLRRYEIIKDILGIVGFILAVVVGAAIINQFLFRSFSVSGPSMEPTFFTGDRLIVNRIPVTFSYLQRKPYVPERGQIIVFKNPHWSPGGPDEYIIKRVIAFPGERVSLRNGVFKVYNQDNPNGIDVDDLHPGATSPTAGEVNTIVPDNEIFVSGDHRQEGYSLDSRNGLGTIPYEDFIGPVSIRIFPFSAFKLF